MITYWVNAGGGFGMEQWLAKRVPDLANLIQVRSYESLQPEIEVTAGAHLFCGLDQLGPAGRATVTALHDRLAERAPSVTLLNNPATAARRSELLTRMFDAGINGFRAHQAAGPFEAVRYPAFLREASGHGGPLTDLLASPQELQAALRALRARGSRVADLLVVEFCNLSDGDGVFHTAAAYKVGERIVPAYLLSGRNWVLKWTGSDQNQRALQESRDYVFANPHEAWVRGVFTLARVDYGRLDYGVRGDTLQAWEINLNPTLGPGPGPEPPPLAPPLEALLQEARRTYNNSQRAAFRALDPATLEERLTLRLDPGLLALMRAESAGTRRRRAALRFLHGIYDHPRIGWPFRKAYSWLLPVSSPRH